MKFISAQQARRVYEHQNIRRKLLKYNYNKATIKSGFNGASVGLIQPLAYVPALNLTVPYQYHQNAHSKQSSTLKGQAGLHTSRDLHTATPGRPYSYSTFNCRHERPPEGNHTTEWR